MTFFFLFVLFHFDLTSVFSFKTSVSVVTADDALGMDQFEVSECTLSGSSAGNLTEDGVVASCHPPLPWDTNTQILSPFLKREEKKKVELSTVCAI